MSDIADRLETAKNSYFKVVNRFPDIDPYEFELLYTPGNTQYAALMILDFDIEDGKFIAKITDGEMTIRPRIMFGEEFFKLKKDEQEAIVAHEIGHYAKFRKRPSVEKAFKRDRILGSYKKLITMERKGHIFTHDSHAKKRIMQWSAINEMMADTEAAKAGYAGPSLRIIKKVYMGKKITMTRMERFEAEARIENLERFIEENG